MAGDQLVFTLRIVDWDTLCRTKHVFSLPLWVLLTASNNLFDNQDDTQLGIPYYNIKIHTRGRIRGQRGYLRALPNILTCCRKCVRCPLRVGFVSAISAECLGELGLAIATVATWASETWALGVAPASYNGARLGGVNSWR